MKNIGYALAISFIIHLIGLGSVIGWSLYKVIPGGGTGLVEVGIVGPGGNASAGKIISRDRHVGLQPPRDDKKDSDSSQDADSGNGSGQYSGGSGSLGGSGQGSGDQRLVEIWQKINRKKYYPEIARQSGLEGNPKVSFNINLNGEVDNVSLVRSCGHDILDQAALKTISRSSPLPFYPQPITIAIRYSLNNH
ncbi:MAG: energy transducer TonB [Pseudomonadota bacterium]